MHNALFSLMNKRNPPTSEKREQVKLKKVFRNPQYCKHPSNKDNQPTANCQEYQVKDENKFAYSSETPESTLECEYLHPITQISTSNYTFRSLLLWANCKKNKWVTSNFSRNNEIKQKDQIPIYNNKWASMIYQEKSEQSKKDWNFTNQNGKIM